MHKTGDNDWCNKPKESKEREPMQQTFMQSKARVTLRTIRLYHPNASDVKHQTMT